MAEEIKTRQLDTVEDFVKFARKAGLESPLIREEMWRDIYQKAHPEVFEVFFKEQGGDQSVHALVRELSRVLTRVKEAAPVMSGLIDETEPVVRRALGMTAPKGDQTGKAPLHVLMVGTFSTNGFAARLGDEVAVFHCLEWFSGAEPTKVLVAHETTHAWHQIALGENPGDDAAWTAFYEGLAIQASRHVVKGRPEEDYFWYGVAGFEDWLPECRKDEDKLLKKFARSLDDPDATESFFGSGFVNEKWRTGFYLADLLVGRLAQPLDKLVQMSPNEARAAVREILK